MVKRYSDADIVKAKGRVSYNSVEPSQKPLVLFMRNNPGATLDEARNPARYYRNLSDSYTWEQLHERDENGRYIVKGHIRANISRLPYERVSISTVARQTGIDQDIIEKRLRDRRNGGVDPRTLEYRPSRGFYAYTIEGHHEVVLYAVRNTEDSSDFFVAFGTSKEIEQAISTKVLCVSPP